MFSSVLFVASHPDFSSSVTLSLPSEKTSHPLVNCCFLQSIIPVNLHVILVSSRLVLYLIQLLAICGYAHVRSENEIRYTNFVH